jgi:DNA polymerase III epsilon subunit-like protein
MNFFIDFEATQFTQEIISVGCVCENGESFYSTVRSNRKVTSFITELTGLDKEEILQAPSADEVFLEMYHWMHEQRSFFETENFSPKFYTYGNGDSTFVKNTISNTTNFFANSMLCIILGNMIDYSEIAREKLGLAKKISLTKLLRAFRGEELYQKHHSLDDAFFLQELFNCIEDGEELKFPVEPKYYINDTPKKAVTAVGTKGKHTKQFSSIGNAANWLISQMPLVQRKKVTKKKIASRISSAAKTERPYFNFIWVIEREGNG